MQRGVRIITRSRRRNCRRRSRKISWKKSCFKGNFKRLQKLKIQDRVPRPTLIECAIWNWESKKEKDLRLLAAERLHQIWNWVEGKVLFGTHPVKRGRKSHFLSGILNRDTYLQVGFLKKEAFGECQQYLSVMLWRWSSMCRCCRFMVSWRCNWMLQEIFSICSPHNALCCYPNVKLSVRNLSLNTL